MADTPQLCVRLGRHASVLSACHAFVGAARYATQVSAQMGGAAMMRRVCRWLVRRPRSEGQTPCGAPARPRGRRYMGVMASSGPRPLCVARSLAIRERKIWIFLFFVQRTSAMPERGAPTTARCGRARAETPEIRSAPPAAIPIAEKPPELRPCNARQTENAVGRALPGREARRQARDCRP